MTLKNKAYLETTIIADCLIKIGVDANEAKTAIAAYQTTELSEYAIKEFKRGALAYVSYLHNKFLDSKSHAATLLALARVVQQPHRVATCLRLIADLHNKIITDPQLASLKAKFGDLAEADKIAFDSLVLESKVLVMKAWKRCDTIATKIVDELPCYKRVSPRIRKDGRYDLSPTTCKTNDCCMANGLRARKLELIKLETVIKGLPPKRENGPRRGVLHNLAVKPNYKLKDKGCRDLGDAVFALFCPKDSDLLTTNLSDIRPLAQALAKTALSPKEVLS